MLWRSVAYYVPIAMLFAYSNIRNLAVTFQVTLLSGTAAALCYDGGWFRYIILVQLIWLCAHHMFLKVNHVRFVLLISSKVMGRRKFKLRHIKNAEKRGNLVVAIPRAKVFVEGSTLSLPVPEIISLQPVKAPA